MSRYSYDYGRPFVSIGPAIAATAPDVNANTTPNNPGNATGAGDEVAYVPRAGGGNQFPQSLTWDYSWDTGTFTALVINLEGSNDGTHWNQVDTNNATTTPQAKSVANKPYRYWRLNVGTFTVNSGNPVVTGRILF